MKKIYILVTGDIHPIGGMQLLASGKAEVLEEQGWRVIMFFPTHENGSCVIETLNKYVSGGFTELTLPPYKWTPSTRKRVIRKMCELIGPISADDKIIIESHSDRTSQWGEILAAKINAKHMLFLCNETYRGKDKYYVENLDYYDFKHKRKEVAGEVDDIFFRLFENYKTVDPNETNIFWYDENPVRNVNNEKVNAIQKSDWNIGYIGRMEKGYVPNIIKSVAMFAKRHEDKQIQFVIVGDISSRKQLMEEILSEIHNLKITALGDVVPIPSSLFRKLDVVIGGSGSAKCAVYEGVYTIIADAANFQSNGVFGYDTDDYLYHGENEQTSFDESLEKVLVRKEYDGKEPNLPPYIGPKECTMQNFELIEASVQTLEYYPEERLCSVKTSYLDAFIMRVYDWVYRNLPCMARWMQSMKRKICGV